MRRMWRTPTTPQPTQPASADRTGTGAALALGLVALLSPAACGWVRSVDLPTLADAGGVVSDGGPLGGDGGQGCKWVVDSPNGCVLGSVACNQAAACPAVWAQANSAASCRQSGTSFVAESCEGAHRWTLLDEHGTTVVSCYYDLSTGALNGIDAKSEAPITCGGEYGQMFGNVPSLCHDDAGVEVQRITCGGPGAGNLTDGGFSLSCSQAAPCYGGG